MEAVHPDAVSAQIAGEAAGQTDHAALAGVVVGLVGGAESQRDAAHIDDRTSPGSLHVRDDRVGAVPRSVEVDVENPVPLGPAHGIGRQPGIDSGIVHQHIDASEGLDDPVDRRSDL